MTKEQKIKLIELVQEYFEDADEEAISTYGYTIPMFEFRDMLSLTLFGKWYDKAVGFNRKVAKHYYTCALTDEELIEAKEEFKMLLDSKAFSFTKSKKAIRVSEDVVFYCKD